MTAALEARGIIKSFPGVKALDDVSMTLEAGTIHALLGENGAGKSTLIKIITGIHRPDSGTLYREGQAFLFDNARDAIAAGIGVVHQERNLIPRFSIGENIMLDRLGGSLFRPIDFDSVHREARKWLDLLELDLDPHLPVSRLSVAKMQLVEIAKALSLQSRVLLLDEPTASLTSHETETLFRLLKRLRNDGVAMIFVSHKLEEVAEICDSVTVLRDGKNACTSRSMQGLVRQDLVKLMIGRGELISDIPVRDRTAAPAALELEGVTTKLGHRNIHLVVHEGEILGLYGLVGAGRTELAKCIIGQHSVTSGTIRVHGREAQIANVTQAIEQHKIGYVSEDRKQEGLILIHSVLDNAGIPIWKRLAGRAGFVTNAAVAKVIAPIAQQLEVKTPSLDQLVGLLSGGNQQKISLIKWLAANVKILIVDEPSVGIDIKTKAYIHDLLRDLAARGTSILLITSDLPEMITVADRIVAMDHYRIKGEVKNTRDYSAMSEAIMGHIHDVENDAA